MYDNIIYVWPLKRDTFGEAEKKINDTALFAFLANYFSFFPKKRQISFCRQIFHP